MMSFSSSTVKFGSDKVIDRFLDNVDVWQAIFKMLEVKDRIRLEMTNKRLHILMLEYWKRVTSFDAECVTEMCLSSWMECHTEMSYVSWTGWNPDKPWATVVSICVNRIGDGLRSLTIRNSSMYPVGCWTDNVYSIGEGCPNVETINFLVEDNDGTLDIRFDSFSNLKTIIVSTERGGDFPSASASVFLSIPSSIEVIRGLEGKMEEPFENGAQMEGFFANRPSFREVCLGYLITRDESKADIFRVIAERCPHLKSIEIPNDYNYCIDFSGVIALESMKELRIPCALLDEMQIVTFCERSPLVEALSFDLRLFSNLHLQSAALNALSALTKLRELTFSIYSADEVVPSLVTEFFRELARNSGKSLRRLDLSCRMPLSTETIEALANGCGRLRSVTFFVRVGEATPASIRFLIDCIVAHPSWIHQTREGRLVINIHVTHDYGDEYTALRAPFEALADPAANLPAGVWLNIA